MVEVSCPLCCNETFATTESLKSHILELACKIQCPVCQTKCETLTDLAGHLDECRPETGSILEKALLDSKESDDKEYYCQSCDSHFDDVDVHLATYHEGQEIVMEEEEEEKAEDPLVVYLEPAPDHEVKDKDGRLYTRKFVKIDKFWEESNDSEANVNRCEVCNTSFPSFKSLRLHWRMHEPVKSRELKPKKETFECHVCNKSYDKEFEAVHLASHDPSDEFICDVCNRKFHTKSNLEMHVKAHSNNKKFTCSYCKKPFVTYDALNAHLAAQCQKRPYECQYCGRRFTRPHEKVKHERIHTGEKPHVCEVCGKAFRVSYCLTLHMRTHSGARPYECGKCGKRFKSHSVYNHHMQTHSDVRAYKCPYCPKAFKTGVQLAGHKNSHIKPFTCTECNRPFASLYAVRAHMESHKRDNSLKYECWMCGALYSRAFALRDHLKQQHQQNGEEKAEEEEVEATSSILISEGDLILELGADKVEVVEQERGEV